MPLSAKNCIILVFFRSSSRINSYFDTNLYLTHLPPKIFQRNIKLQKVYGSAAAQIPQSLSSAFNSQALTLWPFHFRFFYNSGLQTVDPDLLSNAMQLLELYVHHNVAKVGCSESFLG